MTEVVHRVHYRNPGCLLLMFVVAVFVAALPAGLINAYWYRPEVSLLLYPLLTLLITWGFVRLYKHSTKRIVPLCPHRGVATNDQFRICATCKRVKY